MIGNWEAASLVRMECFDEREYFYRHQPFP